MQTRRFQAAWCWASKVWGATGSTASIFTITH
jgi:hypothetical protein